MQLSVQVGHDCDAVGRQTGLGSLTGYRVTVSDEQDTVGGCP